MCVIVVNECKIYNETKACMDKNKLIYKPHKSS